MSDALLSSVSQLLSPSQLRLSHNHHHPRRRRCLLLFPLTPTPTPSSTSSLVRISLSQSHRRQRKATALAAASNGVATDYSSDAPSSIELVPITTEEQFDRIIDEAQQLEESVVVLWMANWCRKCIYLKPKLEKLAADYYSRIRFYCVDVNTVPQKLVSRAGITWYPVDVGAKINLLVLAKRCSHRVESRILKPFLPSNTYAFSAK